MSGDRVTIGCSKCGRRQMLLPQAAAARARQRAPCQYCGGVLVFPAEVAQAAAATMATSGDTVLVPCPACARGTRFPVGGATCPFCELRFVVQPDGRAATMRPKAEHRATADDLSRALPPLAAAGLPSVLARIFTARVQRGDVSTWELGVLARAVAAASGPWSARAAGDPRALFLPADPDLAEPLLRHLVFAAPRHRVVTTAEGQPVELAFPERRTSGAPAAKLGVAIAQRIVQSQVSHLVYKSDGLGVTGEVKEDEAFDWILLLVHLRPHPAGALCYLETGKADGPLGPAGPAMLDAFAAGIELRRAAIFAYLCRAAILGVNAWNTAARVATASALAARLLELGVTGPDAQPLAARLSPPFPPGMGLRG